MSAAGARAWCGADEEVLMAETREQPGLMPCWPRAPGRTHAGHQGAGGWAGIPTGWHHPAALQDSPRAWGQRWRVFGLGAGSVAQPLCRAAPGLNGMLKACCADHTGSSPLSSSMPRPHCVAWEQVRVMRWWRDAWARAVGWGRGRKDRVTGGYQLLRRAASTIHPCSTDRGTRGIESAELGTRNAYKYLQSFSAGGRGQPGMGTAEGWGQRGVGCCAPGRLRPCMAAPWFMPCAGPWRGGGGSAMVPGICHVHGRGKGQSEG